MDDGISILIASRKKDNINFGLPGLLQSLKQRTGDPSVIEVLIKFDDDDEGLDEIIGSFHTFPFKIKHFFSPRGKGYLDLHVFYNFLYLESDRNKNLIMAMADDFVILEDAWERIVFNAKKGAGDLVILHQWLPNLGLPFERIPTEDHRVDEAPVWSRKLIDLWGGFGQTSCTDGWTVTIEWILKKKYGMSITGYLKRANPRLPIVDRKLCTQDFTGARWNTVRQRIMETFVNPNFKAMIYAAAENTYRYNRGFQRLKIFFYAMKLNINKYYFKRRGRPIDTSGVTIHGTENMVSLVEEGFYGYNIVCTQGFFYAILQPDGEFLLSKFNQGEYSTPSYKDQSLENIKKIIKSNVSVDIGNSVKKFHNFIPSSLISTQKLFAKFLRRYS